MSGHQFTVFLAGDAIITRPWSDYPNTAFLDLVQEMRSADVAITNLETVIHQFKGYAQADCGGTYISSPPEIAAELKWAGIDMVAYANNHSFDYGSSGVLETIDHVEKAGLVLAGSGKDLQEARAPRYFHSNGRKVALVAMASSFVPYGRASLSRKDVHGRPGLNPLRLVDETTVFVTPTALESLRWLARLIHRKPPKIIGAYVKRPVRNPKGSYFRFGARCCISDRYGIAWDCHAEKTDLDANLEAISDAARSADIVVASVHAHKQGAWLETFARQAIDHGASIVFVHGPHFVRGIELYRRRPIFYSLGDFVVETAHITRFPAEFYERHGLSANATIDELRQSARAAARPLAKRKAYEGFVTSISFTDRDILAVQLHPIDLQFDAGLEDRGRPQLAAGDLGKSIILNVSGQSQKYGTRIQYDQQKNCGHVILG